MMEILNHYHECKECNLWHNKLEVYIISKAKWENYDRVGYALGIEFRQESRSFFSYFKDSDDIGKMFDDAGVRKLEDLIGKPCFCYEENGSGKFLRMWKIG